MQFRTGAIRAMVLFMFNTVEVMILHYLKENKSINIEDLDTRNILDEMVESINGKDG